MQFYSISELQEATPFFETFAAQAQGANFELSVFQYFQAGLMARLLLERVFPDVYYSFTGIGNCHHLFFEEGDHGALAQVRGLIENAKASQAWREGPAETTGILTHVLLREIQEYGLHVPQTMLRPPDASVSYLELVFPALCRLNQIDEPDHVLVPEDESEFYFLFRSGDLNVQVGLDELRFFGKQLDNLSFLNF